MPNVNRLIRDQGAELTSFYVEQSSCCPSRASILSGLYAHNHGVIGNVWPAGRLRPLEADQAGRRPAGLAGAGGLPQRAARQVLQRVPLPPGQPPLRRREGASSAPTSRRAGSRGPRRCRATPTRSTTTSSTSTARWTPTSTRTTSTPGSASGPRDLVDGADGFDFAEGGQFLYYASYSPHTPYAYPPELEGSFADVKYPRTPDFDEADVSDKFGLTRDRKPLSASDIATIDETYRKRIRSLQVLDQTVADLVQELKDRGHARQHLPDLHQRQRLPHGQPPSGDRQVHPVPDRRATCPSTSGDRASRPARPTTTWPATSTSRRRSPRSPARQTPATSTGSRCCRGCTAARRWTRQATSCSAGR